MTELSIHIPKELVVTPETLISEQQLPLIPADRLRGIIHPDRLPFLVARQEDVEQAIALHEDSIDPHPQYAKDSDLATHASDPTLHLHDGAIANAQVAANAAIAWTKLSKVGANAGDVGAQPAFPYDQQSGSVKPTARSTGAALQVGDRWLDTSDRLWWWWDGSYWLSEEIFLASTGVTTASVSTGLGLLSVNPSYNLYLLNFSVSTRVNTTGNALDSTNYWTISLMRMTTSAESSELDSIANSYPLGQRTRLFSTLNLHRDITALSILGFQFQLVPTNAPTSLVRPSATLRYRLVKP